MLLYMRSFSQSFVPDTSINRIVLVDSTSVLNILGKDCRNFLIEDNDRYKIIVYNKDKSEKLEMIFHEGDNRNSFSEFMISKIKKGNITTHKFLILNEDHFKSARDIKLGLSQKSVELKLGFALTQKQSTNGEVTLFFRRETNKDPIFTNYNMPIYYGEYVFRNNCLISFSFGFEEQ